MTAFAHVMDLPAGTCRIKGGTFRLVPEGEFFTGQWSAAPAMSGPRQMRWMADLELSEMLPGSNGDARFKWESFVARLQGQTSAFRLSDPWRGLPRGAAAGIWRGKASDGYLIDGAYKIDGAWTIDGGSHFATVRDAAPRWADVIVLSGLVPSATVLRDGDHFSLGDNLYMAVDDAIADANGHAAVRFLWKLWKPALAGDMVNFHKPTGRFVLRDIDGGTMVRSGAVGSVNLTAIEVPDAG